VRPASAPRRVTASEQGPLHRLETGVLRNRLGITDAAELAQAESELTSYRLIELRRTDLPGRYDLPPLQGFHRYICGDLYDWAGELRWSFDRQG
jgi:cell filamentation protein